MLSLLPTHNRCQCHFTIPYVMLLIQSLKNGDRFHYFPSVSWLLISSLRKKKVGFKQDERELFWGFRHEKELTRDLSGLFPLRFLFLRPKKIYIYIYLLALKSYTNHHHHTNLVLLLWTRTLPLEGMSENSKIQCFKCEQHPTCRPSSSHVLWVYGPRRH